MTCAGDRLGFLRSPFVLNGTEREREGFQGNLSMRYVGVGSGVEAVVNTAYCT